MRKNLQKGQTLFELLVAIAIGVVIITGIVILTTLSIGNSNVSKNDANGLRYAQEGLEWVRAERDKSWATVIAKSSNSTSYYCISSLNWNTASACNSSQVITGTTYRRTLSLKSSDSDGNGQADTIDATILIQWDDGGKQHATQIATQLTSWKGQE